MWTLASTLLVALSFSYAEPMDPIPLNDKHFVQKTSANEIKIMNYNVYNLFDAVHDEGKNDYTFLPINYPGKADECKKITSEGYQKQCLEYDWQPHKVDQKISQIVKILNQHGSKPDILALQEIENENVIAMLAKAAGYKKYAVTDYPGSGRGIDVAALYNTDKLEMLEEFYVEAPGRDPYRLKFRFKKTGTVFYVYVNHWLAQSAPVKYRVATAEALRKDVDTLPADARVIALGDFNTKDYEEPEVFDKIIFDEAWSNRLWDIHKISREKYPESAKYFPDGSFFFLGKSKKWRIFDRFFVSKNLVSGAKGPAVILDSYRVVYSNFMTTKLVYKVDPDDVNSEEKTVRYPSKYNFTDDPKYDLGFSDHLPISMIVRF